MGMWMDLAGFAGILALGQMIPGPDWILVTRVAVAKGMRHAVSVATGIACGLMVHASVAVGGLAIYVRRSEVAWSAVRWMACGYLVWVAVSILREGRRDPDGDANGGIRERPFLSGFACNLLNGKVSLMLAALCATYLQETHGTHWPWILWCVIVVQGWLLWIVWAAVLQRGFVRETYLRFRRGLDVAFASGLLLLAARLLWESR